MTISRKLYDRIEPHIGSGRKAWIRRLLERVIDVGKTPSFSQFGQDVFLQGYFEAKAYHREGNPPPLKRPKLQPGFYVDIGAYSPKQYSNTYLFYKQGWRGINVDATPGSMKAFEVVRPRDINIEAVISGEERDIDFYCWSVPGVLNTVSRDHAETWARKLGREPQVIRKRTMTLESLFKQRLPEGRRIDFLSVDVEGHDLEVLRGNNWDRFRPELVIVEDEISDFAELKRLDVTEFMREARYALYSWMRPNIIFRDAEIPDNPEV